MITFRLIIATLMLISFLCLGHPVVAETQKPVRVGVILPLTGAFARYGQRIQEAVNSYASPEIEFVFEDEGCDPKRAMSAYHKLAELDRVKLFLGPWCGSPQIVVAQLMKDTDGFSLLGSSAPIAVYELSGGRMYSTQHSIEADGKFVAEQLNRFGVKSVAIVFYENGFSRAHEAGFRAHFQGVVQNTFAYTSSEIGELKAIAMRIRQGNPEALYVPDAFPLMGGFMKELQNAGVKDKTVYSVYSAQAADVLEVVGKDAEKIVYSYPDIGDREVLDVFPALAAKLLTEGVKQCREDTACLRTYLNSNARFDKSGVLEGKLILKTVRNGQFVLLQ